MTGVKRQAVRPKLWESRSRECRVGRELVPLFEEFLPGGFVDDNGAGYPSP